MCTRETAARNYKKVCKNFPNFAILTKSATPGEVHLTFGHTGVVNKYLGESVVAFDLAGYLSSPYVVSLNMNINFSTDGNNIRLPIAEVLLCVSTGNLARSKKQRDWTPRNTVLLPPFPTKATILHGESDAVDLLKVLA